jgi:SAM-dependent methyltransferase
MWLKLYNWILSGNLFSRTNGTKEDTYMLATGRAGQKRLNLIDDAYGHFSRSLLESLRPSLPKNAQILTVGCGTGTMECPMAQYWPGARITAVDSSPAQLEIARKNAFELRLTNINFIEDDAKNLLYTNCYDLVYARFLLMHVQDPLSILKCMEQAAKPGALIICEELSSSSYYCEPYNKFYAEAFQLIQGVAKKMRVDYDIGAKLPGLMANLGLTSIQRDRQKPDRSNLNVKKQLVMAIAEAKPKLLAKNFDEQALDALLAELEAFANQDTSRMSMSDLFQVVGRKPLSNPH